MDTTAIINHHSILIGVNAYPEHLKIPENARDPSLKGCVQDVQDIKKFMDGLPFPVGVKMLTATRKAGPPPQFLAEDPQSSATYDNVLSTFENLTSVAKSGDVVYIHFSGHGTRTRAESPSSEDSSEITEDLALVLPCGEAGNDIRYLRGTELADLLKRMVDKGLIVTLVLDCCFSGIDFRRDDASIRALPYDPTVDLKYPTKFEKSVNHAPVITGNRDASIVFKRLTSPRGYTILTACGPNEIAKELQDENGHWYGALSYFLLRTLVARDGIGRKHRDVYHHLCARFRDSWPKQNPSLYGNKEQGFFGQYFPETRELPISVVRRSQGDFQLQAGRAHGVQAGDKFQVYRLESIKYDSTLTDAMMMAEITYAGALTSDLKPVGTLGLQMRTGWMARSLTRNALGAFWIKLPPDPPYCDEWMRALQERSLNVYTDDVQDRPFSFQIVLSENHELELRDESNQTIINIPPLSRDQIEASYICDILEHLAKYNLVKTISNETASPPFRDAFNIRIKRSDKLFDPDRPVEVKHDEKAKPELELEVENKGTKDLYLHVYDLGPFWQIENALRGNHDVVLSKFSRPGSTGLWRKKMKTVVPAEMLARGDSWCIDIIKVFVTSRPTSFDTLELPKMGVAAKKTMPQIDSSTGRGTGVDALEHWLAFNFSIRTYLG